ncbi:MFS transporter [Streptomyces sp. ME19-01-6]|uniref:MFS transporter n=1 Tax=Streptomyces sp. ME19-01-6 TaxID=3028686 RepID=UPI0029B16C48|nr:MFS transporter [Streptomyces sp. ME19-01-6]MDX3230439.1 MFS transporter [Streptomyces sp. ME19-01-6]
MDGLTSAREQETGRTPPYAKGWGAAIVMVLAAMLDLIDASIVNTALPAIGQGLDASATQLEWMVSAYMLGFAATLIIAGHLGDRFGRKRLFLTGVAGFALASLGSAVAAGAGQLIGARAVQGVAAALLLPQVLGTVRTLFDGAERAKVFALYGAVAGTASAVGVVLGGVLTDRDLFGWGWRTVFAVNVPIAVAVFVLGALWIPDERAERISGRLGLPGALTLAAALAAIVLPLIEGRANGWPLWGWVLLASGCLTLIALVRHQSRRGVVQPLLPTALFARSAFGAGLVIQMLFAGGMSGYLMVFTVWLQSGQGYTPTQAGLVTVTFSAGAFLSAPFVNRLVARFGRYVLAGGGLLMAVGFAWVGQATSAAPAAWPLVPGFVVAGAGLGFVLIPLVNIVLSAVPVELAGCASGIFSTAQQFGGALGVALIGNTFFAHVPGGWNDAIAHAAPWTAAAFLAGAALCLALPRENLVDHDLAA